MAANPRGSRGEDHAAAVLAQAGYQILARNARSPYGEVDIVAAKGDVIAFVEVKTRRQSPAVTGAEAVGRAKQQRIIKTALLLLQEHPEWDLQPRFDLIAVTTDSRGRIGEYDWIKGAFDGQAYEAPANH